MDVNGTKFHLLLTRNDWGRSRPGEKGELLGDIWQREDDGESTDGQKFAWDKDLNEITLQKRVFKFTAAPKDKKPELETRRGGARDRYGNWYWIDESGTKIRVLSTGSKRVSDFYPATSSECAPLKQSGFQPVERLEKTPVALRGLCVTIDHYLVVGTLEPAGLLVFDLFSVGEPRRIVWNADTAFAPYDMAARRCGGVFVLDRDNRRYWTLDRGFNPVGAEEEEPSEIESPDIGSQLKRDDFQPLDGSEERIHGKIEAAEKYYSKLDAVEVPISIE